MSRDWIDDLITVNPYGVARAQVRVGTVRVFDGYRAGSPSAIADPKTDADAFARKLREQIRYAAEKGRPS